MKINLYDVLSTVGRELVVEADFSSKQVTFQGETISVAGKAPFEVRLTHIRKDVVALELTAEVTVSRACSRCLEDVVCDYTLQIARIIDAANKKASVGETEDFDDIGYIEDCTLDVDMLVLDELYTVLPMNALCREDCRGICKVCGTNLNKGTCDCDQAVPDPRMAVFSDIFNQFKEV